MNRNVLISFLGVGPSGSNDSFKRVYKRAKYKYEGHDDIIESSFISEALDLVNKYKKKYILGTVKSMWEEYYNVSSKKEIDEGLFEELALFSQNSDRNSVPNEELFKKLENNLESTEIKILHYGITKDELLKNISIISEIENSLQDGDIIDIDITHSFRSIPILATVFISYLKDVSLKKLSINKIYYGMLDISKEMGDITPIVDISPLLVVMDWTKAAYSFQNFGNGYLISEFLQNENKYLSDHIKELTDTLQINLTEKIKNIITRTVNYDRLSETSMLIVPKVIEEFKVHFKAYIDSPNKKDSVLLILLSEYYLNKKIYSSAYIVLDEAIVKYVMEQENKPDSLKEIDFFIDCKKKISNDEKYISYRKDFTKLNEIRNNIGHSLYLKDVQRAINELPEYIRKFKKLILSNSK